MYACCLCAAGWKPEHVLIMKPNRHVISGSLNEVVFIHLVVGSTWLPVPACVHGPDMAVHCADRWCAAPGVPLVAAFDAVCYTPKVFP
jgi:hypothetical protein